AAQRHAPVPALESLEKDVERAVAAHERVIVGDHVEPLAYAAGPRLHVVDLEGDTDPLLARIPAEGRWRPGHMQRKMPPPYIDYLESGADSMRDGRLVSCEESLALLARAPMFDRHRFRAMVAVNLGSVCRLR